MNIMQRMLSIMIIGEQVQQKTLLQRVQEMQEKPLSYSQKSSLRNSIFKLGETGMVKKEMIGATYWYTLLKDKKFYVPLRNPYQVIQTDGKPRPSVVKSAIDWYGDQKVYKIEALCKELNVPLPKTREEIIEFHKKAIAL